MSEQLSTIYGMIGQASEQKPDRLFYRTLFGTKFLPNAVIDIEYMQFIIPTLPTALQDVAKGLQDIFIKSLTSTTSIKGQMLNVLTTHKSQISVSNPNMRKNMLGNLIKQGGGGEGYGGDY